LEGILLLKQSTCGAGLVHRLPVIRLTGKEEGDEAFEMKAPAAEYTALLVPGGKQARHYVTCYPLDFIN
jgi:hypothetical protein